MPEHQRQTENTKLKRGFFHDYHSPSIYLVTVAVVDRASLLGQVEGDTERAAVVLSEVGKAVKLEVYAFVSIESYYFLFCFRCF